MDIAFIITSGILILSATFIQLKDCKRNYGNTMGIFSLIGTIWFIAGICLSIGLSTLTKWYWSIGFGLALYILYYPVSSTVEKFGSKYMPANKGSSEELSHCAAELAEEIRQGEWNAKIDKSIPISKNVILINELEKRYPGFPQAEYEKALCSGMFSTK